MEKQTVSVIVPVYNIAEDLPRCAESVLNQTYDAVELILVDDGSTDGSSDVCDLYALQDSRVKVIHQKNAGVSAARNAGIEKSSGEYITFLDSDDYLEAVIYEKMVTALESENLDIVACGVFSNDTPIQHFDREETRIVSREEAIRDVVTDRAESVFCGAVWNKLYRRSLRDQLVFDPSLLMAEDMLVTLQALMAAQRIGCISLCGYHYVQRPGSMVHSYKKNKCSSAKAHEKMAELLTQSDPELRELVLQRGVRHSFHLLMEQVSGENYFPEDVEILRRSIGAHKSVISRAGLSGKERLLLSWMLTVPGGTAALRRIYRLRK